MGGTDRAWLIERINRLADAGLLSEIDRNIRLANARHADTETELQMMGRDLLQWESMLAAPVAGAPAPVGTAPVTLAPEHPTPQSHTAYSPGPQGRKAFRIVVLAMVAIVVAAIVAQGLVASTVRKVYDEVFDQVATPGSGYALDEQGIDALFSEIQERFSTTSVVDLSLYEKYAVVAVPSGDDGVELWYFGDQIKRVEGADAIAAKPGSRVDLGRVDVPALVKNLHRAPEMLGVENVGDRYALVGPQRDGGGPPIAIYIVDDQGVGSFVTTRLNGKVVGIHPTQRV